MPSHEVTRPSVTQPARYAFGPEQTSAIRAVVGPDLTDGEFVLFLELCARYELDPFAKQAWAVKLSGKDKPASIIVGRDGYLAIAERHPAYEGMDGDVVREGDKFQIERTSNGPVVHHDYAGNRGKILGAWACVYRSDRRVPTYFYAPIDDYKPTGNKLQYSPWSKQESVMMLKCAQSTVLRLAFNISGFVPAEEAGVMEDGRSSLNGARDQGAVSEDPDTFDWPTDPDVRGRLEQAFAKGNEIRALAFPPAKVRMLLRGRDDAGYEMLAREIEDWIARREEPQVPVVDAVVVEDPEDPESPEDPEADRLASEAFGGA